MTNQNDNHFFFFAILYLFGAMLKHILTVSIPYFPVYYYKIIAQTYLDPESKQRMMAIAGFS